MSFANLFKALPTTEDHDTAPCVSRRHPQRKGSKRVPSSQEKDHDSFAYNARQQQRHGGKELKASNEKRRGHHDERQGHKTRKSFSHKDNHRGNYKQPSLGFTQQLQQYIHSRDTGLNKTNSRPEVDCRTKHNKYDNPHRPQQQQRRGKWIHKEEFNQHRPNNRGRPFTRSGQHQAYCTRKDFSGRGPDEGGRKDPPVEKKWRMTQEFMDQNGLEVEGHGLVCRHFLCGRCTKGDECQLPHVQNMSNDMLKEVCKFYVVGCCNKGENCPYMHSSFPCKYFHTRGKCFTGAECRFSHEPLTDLTKTLLDGALKRDLDYAEMQMKAQLPVNEPDQSKNTEEPLAAENMAVDKPKLEIRLDSIRPNFYNSSCSSEAHAEKVALCHAGVSADTEKDGVPLYDTDPASVASSHPGDDEIVPYSVEAVLGSQISKIFPSLPGAPAGKESTSPSLPSTSIRCPSNSANQSAVPYSVNAVLESYKSEETSKCSLSSGSISRALYIPLSSKTVPSNRQIPGPPGYSATCKEKVFSGSESNIPLERRVTGQTPAGQGPVKQFSTTKKWPNLPHTSVGSKELVGNISMFQKPPVIKEESQVPAVWNSTSKHFIKTIAHLTTDITGPQDHIESLQANNPAVCSDGLTIKGEPVVATSKNKTAFHNLFLNLPSQSSAPPKCSVQPKSQRPCAPSDQGEPMLSRDPSLTVARSKSALHVSATHITCQSISTNPVTQKCVLKLNEKIKRQSSDTLNLTDSTQPPDQVQVKFNDADCKITMGQDVKSTVDGIKPITKPFHSLFARPLGEILPSVQTTPDSLTTLSCPQNSTSYPTPNSTDCKEKITPMRPVVESGKATERPFLSLFVSPPCEPSAPLPPEQTKPLEPIHCTSSSRGCKQKASHLGVKRLFTDLTTDSDADTPAAPRSSQSPPTTKSKKAKCISATEYNQNINETPKQSESQACRLLSETPDEKSTIPVYTTESSCPRTQTDQHPPKALSHKATPMAATKNSVMSTLFLHLSPYHEDKEPQSNIQNSLSLECENEDRSSLMGQQQEREVEEKKVDELMEKTMQDEPVRIPVESSPCLSMSEPHQQCQSSVPRALSTEKTIPTKHRPAFHPFALQRAAAGSASRTAGLTENQVRTTATHSLPIQPVTQPHTQLAMKRSCQRRKSVNGNGDDTSFSTIKNLFKTLDPTASPFGQ